MISREELIKMEKCSPLLPNPGPEVVEKLLGHITEIESRLKAVTSKDGCKCVCHEYPEHMRMQDALEALKYHQDRLKAATEKLDQVVNASLIEGEEYRASLEYGSCGKHPKMFWVDKVSGNYAPYSCDDTHCTICAEVQAAYERGLSDAGEHSLERYTDHHYRCQCGTLLSSDRVEALIEWRLHILALKDRGAKGGRG